MTGPLRASTAENTTAKAEHSTGEGARTPSHINLGAAENGAYLARVVDAWESSGRQRKTAVKSVVSDGRVWQDTSRNNQDDRPLLARRPASHPPGGEKRRLPEDFAAEASTSATVPKRPRIRSRPQVISDLPSFSKSPKSNETAVSPLFFSHTPRQRPPLPRFSSSEAGAAMMKKAIVEDSNNIIRTVKLARGSISGLSPQRATSTPSGRYPGDRQAISRILTPDEKEATSQSLRSLSQVGILELLEQDDRLAFLIDLGNNLNFQPGPIQIAFANATLKAYGPVLDLVRGKLPSDATSFTGDAQFPEFKAWAISFTASGEALDVALPAFAFGGASWTCSTLRKRFRVFYSVLPSGAKSIQSNPPTAAPSTLSSTSIHSKHFQTHVDPTEDIASEPSDYFGHVQSYNGHGDVKDVAEDILSSVETPLMVDKQTLPRSSIPEPEDTQRKNTNGESILKSPHNVRPTHLQSRTASAEAVGLFSQDQGFFDWTRLPVTAALPKHIQFARSIDWASTSIGPIESWPAILRLTCNLLMASPHPAAMYWGDDNVALYNEPYILLAGQKHPTLMGQTYHEAWGEIWEDVKESFNAAKLTGQSTMKEDDRLFVNRTGFLEETYFSWYGQGTYLCGVRRNF